MNEKIQNKKEIHLAHLYVTLILFTFSDNIRPVIDITQTMNQETKYHIWYPNNNLISSYHPKKKKNMPI